MLNTTADWLNALNYLSIEFVFNMQVSDFLYKAEIMTSDANLTIAF